MRIFTLITKSYAIYLKSMLEYRAAFITDMLTNILNYSMMYAGIWILLERFKMIQGWTFFEVMFIFNLNMFSYALGSFVFRSPITGLEQMVRQGHFDIVLIRPMNNLLYLLFGRPNHSYFGHILLAIAVFIICFINMDIQWSGVKITFLFIAIGGAVLIQMAMYLFVGALNFWVVRTQSVFNTLTWTFRNFIEYPINIYGKVLQVILTFVIPFAFINYYPAHYILDKTGDILFHPILQFGTPVVGIVMFALAYWFWTIGVNKYESTGS